MLKAPAMAWQCVCSCVQLTHNRGKLWMRFQSSHSQNKITNPSVNILPQAQLLIFFLGVSSFCGTRSLTLRIFVCFLLLLSYIRCALTHTKADSPLYMVHCFTCLTRSSFSLYFCNHFSCIAKFFLLLLLFYLFPL